MPADDDEPPPPAKPTENAVPVAVPTSPSGAVAAKADRSTRQRVQTAVGDAVGGAVGVVGGAVGAVGEGVSRVGAVTKKVPIVGAGVAKLGEGIEVVGESLGEIPKLRKTRRGRLLIRSMLVGFVLVAAWIVAIVAFQVRTSDTKDFRPEARQILQELSAKQFDQLYEQASTRFQEITRKDRFIDDMTDLRATVGAFREIAAVNDTFVTTGPSGTVGRLSLSIAFEKATCKSSISFHYSEADDTWKFLGIGVELPPDLKISKQEREERIAACKDPMDAKACDVHAATVAVMTAIDDGRAGDVWDRATPIFRQQLERSRFIAVEDQRIARLGKFRRVIAVSEAKVIGGTNATFDVLCEYEKSSGVRAVVGFQREAHGAPWLLRSLKVVLPIPRAADAMRGSEEGSAAPAKREPGKKR